MINDKIWSLKMNLIKPKWLAEWAVNQNGIDGAAGQVAGNGIVNKRNAATLQRAP